ncbi:MAG: class I SAM-dependent methyltransferase [Chitinophagaceae bacterium]|nr:MAG: class I SAM-dependent methyltransferase [Chitinophagaceae bacterium]
MHFHRLNFISQLITLYNFRTYLEIGVFFGGVFFQVRADKKVAVDPDFQFGFFKKFKRMLRNATNFKASFIEKTSDDFFAQDAAKVFGSSKVDIALIDGMHEFAYVLRDIENTLPYLAANGVMILHDCNPPSAMEAVCYKEWRSRPRITKWNGDVWKSIVYLRSTRPDLCIFTLDCDEGLGFIVHGQAENMLDFTMEQVESFTYDDLAANRASWLNLKDPSYFASFFKTGEAARA